VQRRNDERFVISSPFRGGLKNGCRERHGDRGSRLSQQAGRGDGAHFDASASISVLVVTNRFLNLIISCLQYSIKFKNLNIEFPTGFLKIIVSDDDLSNDAMAVPFQSNQCLFNKCLFNKSSVPPLWQANPRHNPTHHGRLDATCFQHAES
jgi:hypothetical protein